MVLLHGLASNARIWDLTAPLLGRRRLVYALDQRGHGLTDKPDEGYDFPAITADLQAFIQAVDLERPAIAGHSWGASVALAYAASRPVGPWSPSTLALVDGGTAQLSARPGMTWEKAEERLRPPPLAGMPREDFVRRMAQFAPDPALLAPEIQEIVLANFDILEDDTIRPRLTLERHMHIVRAMYDLQVKDLYGRIRCPILIAPAVPPAPRDEAAEQFLAMKREGVALAESLHGNVQTRWFEDTVHDIPLHRPQALAEAIDAFLED
jgi:pimeloyl-ACP methyl ester carboxylesterase